MLEALKTNQILHSFFLSSYEIARTEERKKMVFFRIAFSSVDCIVLLVDGT